MGAAMPLRARIGARLMPPRHCLFAFGGRRGAAKPAQEFVGPEADPGSPKKALTRPARDFHRGTSRTASAFGLLALSDEAKARELFVGFLGFRVVFEDRLEAGMRLRMSRYGAGAPPALEPK